MPLLNTIWQSAFAPRDRRPTREWASEFVILGPPLTKSGPFSTAESRYLEEPIDALDDDRVRQINIRAPVRGGKSLIMDIWIPEIIARRPGPTMVLMEKDDMVEEHAEVRVLPVLKRCKPAAKYLPSDPRKITPSDIILNHGMPLYMRGPSLGNIQNKGIQNMALDEAWRYKQGVIGEAKGRLGDYEKEQTSKLMILSQGGEEESDWADEFGRGILHEWSAHCMKCAKIMPPLWDGKREDGSRFAMRWDEHKDDNGMWRIARCLESIRYECGHCGHPHVYNNRTMSEWNRTAEYVKEQTTEKSPKIKSFEWSGIFTRAWPDLVEQFLHASNAAKRGGYLPMTEFWQKRMAKNKSESSFLLSRAAEIRTAEYKADETWPEEIYRAVTVDCQKDFEDFWAVARAWGPNMESRLLGWKRLKSWDEVEAFRVEHKVESVATFCDVAYTHQTAIREVGKRGYTGLWGHDVSLFTHTVGKQSYQRIYSTQKPATPGPDDGVWFHWAKPTVADFFDLLKRGKAGNWSASVNAGQIYNDHLNAQFKKTIIKPKTGMRDVVWALRKHGMDDHLLDCERMQIVAASMAGVLDDTIFAAPDEPKEKAMAV